ncbi:MAG TPA: transposase family protein, partial [Trebonia sp.]
MSLSQCCSCVCCVPGQAAGLLLPHLSGTVVLGARESGGRVVLEVRPAAAEAACPRCGRVSGRVHSRYSRRLRDVPAGGRDVVIVLEACRLRCVNPDCPAVTFAGQVEGLTSRFARRTPPMAAHPAAVALALCGRAGSRLAGTLGSAPPSRQTMIRLVTAVPVP